MVAFICRLTGHRRIVHAYLGKREAHACWCGHVTQWVVRHG